MKKWIKKLGLAILGIFVLVLLLTVVVYHNELHSLSTIQKLDDYGMYRMTYYGDYGFDEFLKTGASQDSDIENFVTKRLLHGLPIDLGITDAGCTAFVAKNENGEIIYGRNFDFEYAPSMQLITKPKNGYQSISTVNLAFAGYSREKLPSGVNFDSFLTLAAPFLPFDGMNEKGVAIALLAVPQADGGYDADKVTLNTTTAVRLVLDQAADIEEAVELLRQYNIYFSGDVDCHFLIADRSGASVLVEYYDGGLQTVKPDADYQIASNFIAYQGVNIGEGYTEFDRYDAVKQTILGNGGTINQEQAVKLLTEVGIKNDKEDKLQWSTVYNLTTGGGTIFANRHENQQWEFQLKMTE